MLKNLLKIIGVIICLILVINILEPAFHRPPNPDYIDEFLCGKYETDIQGSEKILCIDDNEDALVWRLRMIGSAKESVTFATFDLRTDQSGMDVLSAIYDAAERGVKVKLLLDGAYYMLLRGEEEVMQALAANKNVEIRIYNPITLKNIFRLNYRMHDKYLIVDSRMYILGGRNTNDIFLGDRKTGINVDRDILVYDASPESNSSLMELEEYFWQIWNETCVSEKKPAHDETFYNQQYKKLRERYAQLKREYADIEDYEEWEQVTYEADRITLIHNGTQAGKKNPQVLQVIEYMASMGEHVIIQTPYVICDSYMYNVLRNIADKAEVKIILNAVEKGSNPWGCTDYLNHKKDILKTGVSVYELMNDYAVHTKTILIDENISIVGSYNLDMRSTYLDTELMLVIESEQLNQHIREIETEYMSKSKEVLANGQETEGKLCKEKKLDTNKEIFYQILRVVIRPLRHLL